MVRLLGALDVENREARGEPPPCVAPLPSAAGPDLRPLPPPNLQSLSEELLKEFISCSVVKAADVAQRDAAVHGAARSPSVQPDQD